MLETFLSPHPILFIGPFTFYTHALLFTAGVLVGLLVAKKVAKILNLSEEVLLPWGLVLFATGLLGARLGWVLIYPGTVSSWTEALFYWQGGLVSFWGIATGGLAGMWLLRNKSSEEKAKWTDLFLISVLAAWAVGRLGNYWAEESFGVQSTLWSSFYGRVPIQLFESVLCAALCAAGILILRKHLKPGRLALWLSLGYFAGRLLIDTWRDEQMVAGLHVSQYVSLAAVLVLTCILYKTHERP